MKKNNLMKIEEQSNEVIEEQSDEVIEEQSNEENIVKDDFTDNMVNLDDISLDSVHDVEICSESGSDSHTDSTDSDSKWSDVSSRRR